MALISKCFVLLLAVLVQITTSYSASVNKANTEQFFDNYEHTEQYLEQCSAPLSVLFENTDPRTVGTSIFQEACPPKSAEQPQIGALCLMFAYRISSMCGASKAMSNVDQEFNTKMMNSFLQYSQNVMGKEKFCADMSRPSSTRVQLTLSKGELYIMSQLGAPHPTETLPLDPASCLRLWTAMQCDQPMLNSICQAYAFLATVEGPILEAQKWNLEHPKDLDQNEPQSPATEGNVIAKNLDAGDITVDESSLHASNGNHGDDQIKNLHGDTENVAIHGDDSGKETDSPGGTPDDGRNGLVGAEPKLDVGINDQDGAVPNQDGVVPNQNGDTNPQAGVELNQNGDTNSPIEVELDQNGDTNPQAGVELNQNGDTISQAGVELNQNGDTNPQAGVELDQNGDTNPQAGVELNQNGDTIPQAGVELNQNGDTIPQAGVELNQNGDTNPKGGVGPIPIEENRDNNHIPQGEDNEQYPAEDGQSDGEKEEGDLDEGYEDSDESEDASDTEYGLGRGDNLELQRPGDYDLEDDEDESSDYEDEDEPLERNQPLGGWNNENKFENEQIDHQENNEVNANQRNDETQGLANQQLVENFDDYDDEGNTHFLAYSLTAIILILATYIMYHNKQKIIAVVIEGRNGKGRRRRGGKGYQQLDQNISEAMPSLSSQTA